MRGSRDDDDSTNLDDVERRLREIRDNPEKSTTLRALAQFQLERIAALRSADSGSDAGPALEVTVERLGPFTFSAIPGTGIVAIEVEQHLPVPLVAVVSVDEIRMLMPLFEHVRDHADRGEPVRIDVRAAFRDLLGHDPFDDRTEGR